jgi:hypothetical protein
MSYETGYKIGYQASNKGTNIGAGIKSISDEVAKQREIGRKRQEAFDAARKQFKAQQEEAYGEFVYEDQFTDTGLKDFDAAGEKLRQKVKETYETNMFAFNNGAIDENELRRRNAATKGHVKEMSGVYDKAKAGLEELNRLEAEGKSSAANDVKRQALEDFFNNFRVDEAPVGLSMSTVSTEDGKPVVKTVTPDEFNKLFDFGQGADLDSDLKNIIDEIGSDTYIRGNQKVQDWLMSDGKEGTKDKLDNSTKLRFDAVTKGYSKNELFDAAIKLGVKDKLTLEDVTKSSEEQIEKLRDDVSSKMVDYVKEELRLKRTTSPYTDPSKKVEKPTATEKATKENADAVFLNAVDLVSGNNPESALGLLKTTKGVRDIFSSPSKKSYTIQYNGKDGVIEEVDVEWIYKDGKVDALATAKSLASELLITSENNPIQASTGAYDRYIGKNPTGLLVDNVQDVGQAYVKPANLIVGNDAGKTVEELLYSNEEEVVQKAVKEYLFQNNALSEKVKVNVVMKPTGRSATSTFGRLANIALGVPSSSGEPFIEVSVVDNDGREVHNVQIPVKSGDARIKASTVRELAATIKKIGGGNVNSASSGMSQGAGAFNKAIPPVNE